MDEFAQSREDNDLFADEFEPAPEPTVIEEAPIQSVSKLSPTAETYVSSNGAQSTLPTKPPNNNHNHRKQRDRGADKRRGGRGGRGSALENGLRSSRYATQEPEAAVAPSQSIEPVTDQSPVVAPSISPPVQSPGEAQSHSQPQPQQSKAIPSVRGDRSLTGGPSHKKLTEAELTAKLERMKIINAEKAESFRKSEKDREGYAEKEKEEKRRRKEEIKRGKAMESERMKNRERKLKAMGGREWDEGKDEKDFEDNKGRSSQYVRGGHGGVIRGRAGLASSRFNDAPEDDMYAYIYDETRGRGSGRGRGRGRGNGRGGRGGSAQQPQSVPALEEFPSLPTTSASKNTTSDVNFPLVGAGDWADEMATPIEQEKKL
ncbi:hypothetical protein DSL72_007354 [Monilinia vaccinii-corymbosi]|uniref:Uncharacterized protein n=1 Tax=Monilinia vaccinii-corymbosi TaxID=61207 RepID=A0A8A3PLL5_9HELO|nr:hypothetical protein DSL72_007354 [Monilinia vaccinii-corymbosi]